MYRKAITGIVLTTLLLAMVSPIGVHVGVVDFDCKSAESLAHSSVDWWPMFHHDPRHTGYSTSTAPDTNDILWNCTIDGRVDSSPAVVDGYVYVGTRKDKFYCLNALDGQIKWEFAPTGWSCSPAVVDGYVYVGGSDKWVRCLNASDGHEEWKSATLGNVVSSPAVVDGYVYVGGWGNKFFCFNASDGSSVWTFTVGDWTGSSPAVADGYVYFGSHDHKVYCLPQEDPDHTGVIDSSEVEWEFTTGGDVYGDPAVVDGYVYIGSTDNKLYCLDATYGTKEWEFMTGGDVDSCPAVVDGYVYVTSRDGKVYRLRASDKHKIWEFQAESEIASSPAVADGKVYVGSHDHKVYCLPQEDPNHNGVIDASEVIWSYNTGNIVPSGPAVVDGYVFVGSWDQKVYAFGLPLPSPPRFDKIQYGVRDPEAAVAGMKIGEFDYLPSVPTYEDYESLRDYGFDYSMSEIDEFAAFCFNCRDYAPLESTRFPPGTPLQPLNYSEFRTTLHYALGHEGKANIIAALCGPISYALDSIIPPAQMPWHDPIYIPQNWMTAKNTLFDAGFTVDEGVLKNPDGTEVRTMEAWYQTGIPILQTLVEEYVKVWNSFFFDIGVEAATLLGYPFQPVGKSWEDIVYSIQLSHDFDIVYLETTNLGRDIEWLYDFFHSSKVGPFQYNFGAFINDTCDELTETIMFDLDINAMTAAAKEFQEHFSYEWNPYIVVSSGWAFSFYGRRPTVEVRRLKNWLAMPLYGSDNDWTWALMHWKDNPSGTCDYINRHLSQPPVELHPWYAKKYLGSEWRILDRLVSGLITMNPYTLTDLPWIACDWKVSYGEWERLGIYDGMKVTFYLRQDIYWQNGDQVTAADVKMNWDMLAEWKPGLYEAMWENLVYTEVESPFVVSAYINETSLWTLYGCTRATVHDLADTALFFPERILEEYEARLHDVTDPMYHTPEIFRPWEQDYTSFFVHTHIPVDPDPVDPQFSPIYECRDISDNIGHTCPPAPPKMVEDYKCLIGCDCYIFDFWDEGPGDAHVVRFPDFWWDCPIEQNFIAPTRTDPCVSFEFYVEILNQGSRAFFNTMLDYIEISFDGEHYLTIDGPIVIKPFEHVILGPYSVSSPPGLHYLDCMCYEKGAPLECSHYEHHIWVTVRQDIDLNFLVEVKDIVAAALAAFSYPGHPKWDSRCDVTPVAPRDFFVDIKDIVNIALHSGEPHPCP